jgi:hypothetical protein
MSKQLQRKYEQKCKKRISLERKIQKKSETPKLTNAERCRLYRERKKAERVNAVASTSSAPPPEPREIDLECDNFKTLKDEMRRNDNIIVAVRSEEFVKGWQWADIHYESAFVKNEFGYVCNVCDRLWFMRDLKPVSLNHFALLKEH